VLKELAAEVAWIPSISVVDHLPLVAIVNVKLEFMERDEVTQIDRDALANAAKYGSALANIFRDSVASWASDKAHQWLTSVCKDPLGVQHDFLSSPVCTATKDVFGRGNKQKTELETYLLRKKS
jgi:hypothetical protein